MCVFETGVILLVLKVGSIFAKFHQPYHQAQSAPVIHEPAWLPPQPQPVHVHMHYDDFPHGPPSHGHYDRQGVVQEQVYSGWDRSPPSAPSAPYAQTLAINSQGQYVYRGWSRGHDTIPASLRLRIPVTWPFELAIGTNMTEPSQSDLSRNRDRRE